MAGLYGKGSYFDNDGEGQWWHRDEGPSPSLRETWKDIKSDVKNIPRNIKNMSEFGVACCFLAALVPTIYGGTYVYREYFEKHSVQNSDGKIVYMTRHELNEGSRNNLERFMKEGWKKSQKDISGKIK